MNRSEEKQRVCTSIVQNDYSVYVRFDPHHEDVEMPPWLRYQATQNLQFGRDLMIPIPDLKIDSAGISGTLSFSRTPYKCFVPWAAVYALTGDELKGQVWAEDLPPGIADAMKAESKTASRAKKKKRVESKVTVAAGKLPRTKSGNLLPIGWRVIDGGKGSGSVR